MDILLDKTDLKTAIKLACISEIKEAHQNAIDNVSNPIYRAAITGKTIVSLYKRSKEESFIKAIQTSYNFSDEEIKRIAEEAINEIVKELY